MSCFKLFIVSISLCINVKVSVCVCMCVWVHVCMHALCVRVGLIDSAPRDATMT